MAVSTYALTLFLIQVTFAALLKEGGESPLNTTSRVFEANHLYWINLFKATDVFLDSQCAGTTIIHRGLAKCQGILNMHVIPHAAIFHDGMQCGTGEGPEYTLIMPSRVIRTAQTAAINQLLNFYVILQENERARNAFDLLDDVDPIYVGFEAYADRKCGSVSFPKHTIYIYITPTPGRRDINFGFAYLKRGEVGMLTVKPDQQICMYKSTRWLGLGQPPFLTPTPSPSATQIVLQHSIFNFANEAGQPTCFPAHGIQVVAPTPSKTPSISPSTSVRPTPSATPSNQPTVVPPSKSPSLPSAKPSPSVSKSAQVSPSASRIPSASDTASRSPVTSQSATPSKFAHVSRPANSPSAKPSKRPVTSPKQGRKMEISIAPSAETSSDGQPMASNESMQTEKDMESAAPSVLAKVTVSQRMTASPTGSMRVSTSVSTSPSVSMSARVSTSVSASVSRSGRPSTCPSPSGGGQSSSGRACFPGEGQVQLENGNTKRMADLEIGDRVLGRRGKFTAVIGFSHRDGDVWSVSRQLWVSSGSVLTLSGSHYIGVGALENLKEARFVEVGDALTLSNGSLDVVTQISKVWSKGLYNPHTLDDWIVVDGIVASTFTQAVNALTASALLAPVRLLFRWGMPLGHGLSRWLVHGADDATQSWLLSLLNVVSSG